MLNPKDYRPRLDGQGAIDLERRARLRAIDSVTDSANFPADIVPSNKEEQAFAQALPTSFTKGLHHSLMGTVARADYEVFVQRLGQPPAPGSMAGFDVPIGPAPVPPTPGDVPRFFHNTRRDSAQPFQTPALRLWESPWAGLMTDLQGPAPAGIAQPPAPALGGSELTAEMAEVYAMALLRDLTFAELENGTSTITVGAETVSVQDVIDELNQLPWFDPTKPAFGIDPPGLSPRSLNTQEQRRRMARFDPGAQQLTVQNLFRGSTFGARSGPYVSQFMLLGSSALGADNGIIRFGAQSVDQRVQPDIAGLDYMTEYLEWLDVQNGAAFANVPPGGPPQFLTTLRDMASYVHFDQLYQAYFNAALLMAGQGLGPDAGLPDTNDALRQGFASWGVPHLLALMAEVSSRALRAVRRQKFQVHRRSRPEVLAARLTLYANDHTQGQADPLFAIMLNELRTRTPNLLRWIDLRNQDLNTVSAGQRNLELAPHAATATPPSITENYLLPMAFGEGSPMHPAYGAGHATVAGACVTVLKAFFQTVAPDGAKVPWSELNLPEDRIGAVGTLGTSAQGRAAFITDELDKLAANISIGRNMGGVHYYTDYYESIRMGERIATHILYQNMLTSPEDASMRFVDFDGRLVELTSKTRQDIRFPDANETDAGIRITDPATMTNVNIGDWWRENNAASLSSNTGV